MKLGIGIDLGGTNIKAAAYDLVTGSLVSQKTTPTRDGEFTVPGVPAFATGVASLLEEFAVEFDTPIAAVGMSAPGLASKDHSRIDFMPNKMHGIEGFDWRTHLKLSTATPFAALNDAHAALIGEIWKGSAKGVDNVVMLTLGTGVGGAVVCGGRLITGHIGRAGHLGHLSLDPDGGPDICGTPGSVEDAIGNHNIAARSDGRFSSTRDLIAAVEQGDPGAGEVWSRSVRALGATIVGIINAFDPELMIFGGGIATAGAHITRILTPYLDAHEWRPGGHRVKIAFATLGEFAGTAGAVHFAATNRFTK